MKTKTILLTVIVLMMMVAGVGCEKEKEEYPKELASLKCSPTPFKGKKDDIIGKWKLVQEWHLNGTKNDTVDISCDNVFYEFNKDKVLTVTGNKDEIPEGKYNYEYRIYNPCPTCDPDPNLKIQGYDPMDCIISDYTMIINLKLFIRTK